MRSAKLRLRFAIVLAGSAVAGCIIHDSGGAGSSSVGANQLPASALRPLRQAGAAANRRIGTALMSARLSNAKVRALVVREFDSLTPENEMKWEAIEPQPGRFNFEAGDRLVAFAGENGIRMRGHTLVWHSQLAFWVKGLKADALRAAMTRHIKSVVGHWKGKIAQWDVVNEAIADGPTGELRPDSPFAVLGPTFIDEAFRLAHAADPQAQLFYNDYEIEGERRQVQRRVRAVQAAQGGGRADPRRRVPDARRSAPLAVRGHDPQEHGALRCARASHRDHGDGHPGRASSPATSTRS